MITYSKKTSHRTQFRNANHKELATLREEKQFLLTQKCLSWKLSPSAEPAYHMYCHVLTLGRAGILSEEMFIDKVPQTFLAGKRVVNDSDPLVFKIGPMGTL